MAPTGDGFGVTQRDKASGPCTSGVDELVVAEDFEVTDEPAVDEPAGTMDFEDLEDLQVNDPQPVTAQVVFGSKTFDFDVVTNVEYVDKQGSIFVPSGGSETDLQEVNVTVVALMNINPPIVITSSRIYSRSSN